MGRVVRTLKHGWNAFQKPTPDLGAWSGSMVQSRPNRSPVRHYNDRSIIGSIYNRLAVDFSQVEFFHAKLDKNGIATEVVKDSLNNCLTLDPNIDQNAAAFKVDLALTMFQQGHIAVAPIDADLDPAKTTSYDIRSMRVGTIANWGVREITMNMYDDRVVDDDGNPVNGGVTKPLTMPKDFVAILENPFYDIMNAPNSTLQRLLRKLSILDSIDEAAGSGKLDMILQLPYTVRGDSRQAQAERRRNDLRQQLKDDELGLGYIDISEKVIQLNRPIENKLLEQIKVLYDQLYAELGLTPEIMNGTANRDTINNYYDRTIEPIANTVALEYKRKFLTKTARTQGHSIEVYRDPLKLIPISELAELGDKLIRNAVLTANEFRPKIGYWPSDQPGANELKNPNMPTEDQQPAATPPAPEPPPQEVNSG